MKKSIYVSISCLGIDSQLRTTLNTLLNNTSSETKLSIGISFCGDKNFANEIIKDFTDERIKTTYYDALNNLGIGLGRLSAASMYDNEEYFLQIDAHTYFPTGWDQYLINRFEDIKYKNNNKKIVLSGYLGWYNEDSFFDYLGYTKWIKDRFIINNDTIPYWECDVLNSEQEEDLNKNGFIDLDKIVAMFMFGDSEFAKNICIPDWVLFWEEEIVQSIELIKNGFDLIYPGKKTPFYHYYSTNNVDRQRSIDFLQLNGLTREQYYNMMRDNFRVYCDKNDIEFYEKMLRFKIV